MHEEKRQIKLEMDKNTHFPSNEDQHGVRHIDGRDVAEVKPKFQWLGRLHYGNLTSWRSPWPVVFATP